MNTRFSALLMASLATLAVSGQALANPHFMDRGFMDFSVRGDRAERDFGKREELDARKADRQQDRKNERKAEDERERGYGYGYERRNPQPGYDDRGRR